jgi:DNA-binding NtrC family response regulator
LAQKLPVTFFQRFKKDRGVRMASFQGFEPGIGRPRPAVHGSGDATATTFESGFHGESPQMQDVFTLIRQVAPTNASVLITGESGTGKELVARAIHSFSRRSTEPFIAINCAAMPEALIERELFGHERGAFTGAIERSGGALEMAQGGTLLLDEIGDMPLSMQSKLLRVLEDFRYRRLGGKQELVADVRVLAATNRAPEQALKDGRLREDLYYRLNVFHIALPPLRDHLEDVSPIVASLIGRFNRKHGTRITHLTPDALAALAEQRWEGNVRQLRNVIERAMIIASEGAVSLSHLMLGPQQRWPPAAALPSPCLGVRVGMTVADAERVLIRATIDETNGNKTRAALILSISTRTLREKLKLYNIADKVLSEDRACSESQLVAAVFTARLKQSESENHPSALYQGAASNAE